MYLCIPFVYVLMLPPKLIHHLIDLQLGTERSTSSYTSSIEELRVNASNFTSSARLDLDHVDARERLSAYGVSSDYIGSPPRRAGAGIAVLDDSMLCLSDAAASPSKRPSASSYTCPDPIATQLLLQQQQTIDQISPSHGSGPYQHCFIPLSKQ